MSRKFPSKNGSWSFMAPLSFFQVLTVPFLSAKYASLLAVYLRVQAFGSMATWSLWSLLWPALRATRKREGVSPLSTKVSILAGKTDAQLGVGYMPKQAVSLRFITAPKVGTDPKIVVSGRPCLLLGAIKMYVA